MSPDLESKMREMAEKYDDENDGYNDDYRCSYSYKVGFRACYELLSTMGPDDEAIENAIEEWGHELDKADSDYNPRLAGMAPGFRKGARFMSAQLAARDAKIAELEKEVAELNAEETQLEAECKALNEARAKLKGEG